MRDYFEIPFFILPVVMSLPQEALGRLFKQMYDCYLDGKKIERKEDDTEITKAVFEMCENMLLEQRGLEK